MSENLSPKSKKKIKDLLAGKRAADIEQREKAEEALKRQTTFQKEFHDTCKRVIRPVLESIRDAIIANGGKKASVDERIAFEKDGSLEISITLADRGPLGIPGVSFCADVQEENVVIQTNTIVGSGISKSNPAVPLSKITNNFVEEEVMKVVRDVLPRLP